jgi:hypothetical protein
MAALTAHAPVGVGLRAWSVPARLDALLLAGADPEASAALQRRARVLRGSRRRQRTASGLERAVRAAWTRREPFTAAVPVHRPEVRATRALLLELAFRIRLGDQADPAGLILASRLLKDGTGPLYSPAAPGALRDAAAEPILALGDVGPEPS